MDITSTIFCDFFFNEIPNSTLLKLAVIVVGKYDIKDFQLNWRPNQDDLRSFKLTTSPTNVFFLHLLLTPFQSPL